MEDEQTKNKRHRSPAYPVIGLTEALARLKKFYADQRRATVHLNAAFESLGYSVGSSNAGRVVAALISYGLMSDEGTGDSRKVRITDAGYRLVILDESDAQWLERVRQAALSPKLYADLVAQWPEGLPSDTAIKNHLLLERNFNPDAALPLIKDFRETYEFAQLGKSSTLTQDDADTDSDNKLSPTLVVGQSTNPALATIQMGARIVPATSAAMISNVFTITGGRQAILQLPSDMNKRDYKYVKKHLELLEEAFIDEMENDNSDMARAARHLDD